MGCLGYGRITSQKLEEHRLGQLEALRLGQLECQTQLQVGGILLGIPLAARGIVYLVGKTLRQGQCWQPRRQNSTPQ